MHACVLNRRRFQEWKAVIQQNTSRSQVNIGLYLLFYSSLLILRSDDAKNDEINLYQFGNLRLVAIAIMT